MTTIEFKQRISKKKKKNNGHLQGDYIYINILFYEKKKDTFGRSAVLSIIVFCCNNSAPKSWAAIEQSEPSNQMKEDLFAALSVSHIHLLHPHLPPPFLIHSRVGVNLNTQM